MRIFVFGNINAGKSYSIQNLKDNQFSDYLILNIDQYRRRFGDGSKEGEILSQEQFAKDIHDTKNCFVECTGLGPLGHRLHDKLAYKNDIALYINTDINTCLKRIENKDFSQTPYPEVEEALEDTIKRCGKEFESGELSQLWKDKVLQVFEILNINDIYNIPFRLLDRFCKVVDFLFDMKDIKTIFPYGSLIRNEMTLSSDIDCFVVTDISVRRFMDMLKQGLDIYFIDNIQNKITIRDQKNNLIELVLLKRLSDGVRYIKGTRITTCENVAIKLDVKDEKFINEYSIDLTQPIDPIDDLISEMMYFLYSLPKLIVSDNRYKYYFHNYILVHDYIRIKEVLDGNPKYNHLPKVDWQKYKEIVMQSQDNLYEHYDFMLKKVLDLLNQTGKIEKYPLELTCISKADKS